MDDHSARKNEPSNLPDLTGLDFGEVVAKLQQYLGFSDAQMAESLNHTLDTHRDKLKPESAFRFDAAYDDKAPPNIHHIAIDNLKQNASCPSDSVLNVFIQLVREQAQFDSHIQGDLIHALNTGSRNRFIKDNKLILERNVYIREQKASSHTYSREDRHVWFDDANREKFSSSDPLDQVEATLIMLHAFALKGKKAVQAFDDEHRGETLMNVISMAEKKGTDAVQDYLYDLVRRQYMNQNGTNDSLSKSQKEEIKKITQPIGIYLKAAGIVPESGISML